MVEANEYMIPIKGLKEGWHEFEFILNKNSIDIFDHEMDVKLKLSIDKKSTFYHFYFDFNGKITVECDNCLNEYDEKINAHHEMIIKHSSEEGNFDEGEIEVKFVSLEATQLNVTSDIYEYLMVNIPMKKKCSNGNCDQEVLEILNKDNSKKGKNVTDPRWDALKEIKEELNK